MHYELSSHQWFPFINWESDRKSQKLEVDLYRVWWSVAIKLFFVLCGSLLSRIRKIHSWCYDRRLQFVS
ncbi:hypothetical protein SADUNF_Sadunf11G0081600 [Salix dunnii]|uniref:Uncharacterized protein n=1 Tax=Salix dunnii TaxID=1413687 RepID=A0A835JKA8_9ROSI|nr:hypothetical protein SADUNF_Sadunf11G0081600 [Salix dunnii]